MKKSMVAVVRCESYDAGITRRAVARAFEILGGPRAYFNQNERIVLKPNMASATRPEYNVTTHPAVFSAVAACLKESGVSLSYGDSPATASCERAAHGTGMAQAARELAVPMDEFDTGKKVRYTKARALGSFPIANAVLNSDGLVSIPKFKTHHVSRITGAVKNQYGCIPGLNKARLHARFPLPQDFAAFLVDVCSFVRPRLYVMDAVIAMQGSGPNTGDPNNLGVILMSADPVALDSIACRLVHCDPAFVTTNVAGRDAGLGTYDPDAVETRGDSLEEFADPHFKIPRKPVRGITGSGALRILKDIVAPRPVINRRTCTKCGSCVNICPVSPKAVDWGPKGKTRPPQYDYSLCIRCYCCQEACPERVITVKTPLAAHLVPVGARLGPLVVGRINRVRRLIKFQIRAKTKPEAS
ncbi:MAG: DUF362 domain-containing protein [Chitinivibrionales bacterium]|nr:DUF362 domain-containing protein [Chitinivibrionales bacterium]MBD3397210.1 DUF362 domain-containing protein [Chitinivibrionales bacterium]